MDTINKIMVACGWIITIGSAIGVLYTAYKHYKKPTDDMKHRIDHIEGLKKTRDDLINALTTHDKQ